MLLNNMKQKSFQAGISILEIVLVIAVIGVLSAVVSLPFSKFRQAQALENSTDAVIALLNEARTKTLGAVGNTSYSVHIQSDRAVLFTGTSYNSSEPSNQALLVETPVSITAISLTDGGSEVNFDRLKGTTSQSGTITLALPNGQTRVITVATTGAVSRN
jgi:type II secretory pathway pseudopilin PulG